MRMNSTNISAVGYRYVLRFAAGCLMMVLFAYSGAIAQSTVEGTITSVEDGGPLPGVNVIVKGTTIGTVSDIDGKYALNLPADAETLLFTFIGLKEQELAINGRSVIDLAMTEDVSQLSEVVVTALGVEREERSLGYAIQEIKGEEFTQARETNVVNSLSGKVAGVQVTGASGNLGGSSRVILRGINSIGGDNQPLFVIDGTPVNNGNFNTLDTELGSGGRDYGNAIQDINPDDIESMSVLKGASAAALYGSRASTLD